MIYSYIHDILLVCQVYWAAVETFIFLWIKGTFMFKKSLVLAFVLFPAILFAQENTDLTELAGLYTSENKFALVIGNDAGNNLNVVVLDACRDNPFGWSRSSNRGRQFYQHDRCLVHLENQFQRFQP